MSKINIKKPSQSQLHTLKTYLDKAVKEVEKIESQDNYNDQELEDDILALFSWLTTISYFQCELFIKDDED